MQKLDPSHPGPKSRGPDPDSLVSALVYLSTTFRPTESEHSLQLVFLENALAAV